MHSFDRLTAKFSKHLNKPQPSSDGNKSTQPPPNLFEVNEIPQSKLVALSSTAAPREVKIAKVEELGNVSSTSTFVKRDLGFQGKVGKYIVLTYGDTLYSDAQGSDQWRGMTCNSGAIACTDPTQVYDSILDDNNYPKWLLKPTEDFGEDAATYALGLTNVIETSPGKGLVYFLLNHRPGGVQKILGAGVAEVTIDTTAGYPVPKATRLCKFWWDGETEPWYGDMCALRAGDYIYAYGHAKDNPWVFLTRAKIEHATELDAYEYWNGETWQSERLKRDQMGDKEKIFWQVHQGQIFWSDYHQRYLFIYCDNFWSCQVLIKTALAPEGPWSDALTVHKPKPVQEGGNIYAPIPHPYFDTTSKTLIITYTNHPNTIQAIKVEFE